MDINTLRVFNALYKLNLSEQEFAQIENEVKHEEITGLWIGALRKDFFIGVSHDEKHQIVIKKLERSNQAKIAPNARILFKTQINFEELPQEIYILHQIAQYRSMDGEIRHIADNMEQLKDRVCDRFIDGYSSYGLGGHYDDVYSGEDRERNILLRKDFMEKQLKAVYWLFNQSYNFELKTARPNVKTIVKVFERNNRRLALIQTNESFSKGVGGLYHRMYKKERIERVSIEIRTFTPKDKKYNYVDEGREIYGQIWISDELLGKITVKELELLDKRSRNETEFFLLTPEKYANQQNSLRVELMTMRKRDEQRSAEEELTEKLKKEFEKKGKVVRSGIEFAKDNITYQGVALKGDKILDFIVYHRLITIQLEHPDFSAIVQTYVEYLLEREMVTTYRGNRIEEKFDGKRQFSLGDMMVTVEKRKNAFFVNKCRIRKEELSETLRNILAFASQKDYDEFLKEVSRCSLRMRKAIKNGISFHLVIDKTEDNCIVNETDEEYFVTLKVVRQNNRNFVEIAKKLYPIKNIDSLFELQKDVDAYHIRTGRLQRTIKLLYAGIREINPETIQNLIKIGKKEYKQLMKEQQARVSKSKEFVENAVRLTNAIRRKNGFIVKGTSGKSYFIDRNLGIYTYVNGKKARYICVVDIRTDTEDPAGRNDALAKRLFFLAHDKAVANDIHTLKEELQSSYDEFEEIAA